MDDLMDTGVAALIHIWAVVHIILGPGYFSWLCRIAVCWPPGAPIDPACDLLLRHPRIPVLGKPEKLFGRLGNGEVGEASA